MNTFIRITLNSSVLLLALLINSISFSQEKKYTLTGKVTESTSGAGIQFTKLVFTDSKNVTYVTTTDTAGYYKIDNLLVGFYKASVSAVGYEKITTKIEIKDDSQNIKNFQLKHAEAEEIQVNVSYDQTAKPDMYYSSGVKKESKSMAYGYSTTYDEGGNTESYNAVNENGFKNVQANPLSTFSVDVDAASYSNVRRYLVAGNKPPIDAVRVEEFINYFEYDYPDPTGEHPFSITTEIGNCPWNANNKLVHIGLQAERLKTKDLPANNLAFLLDVSGSMNAENKLPLLKKSFQLLIEELRPEDKVAIVVYAGAAGVVLESTSITKENKIRILESLDALQAGGSTAGGQGIQLAYKVAEQNFVKGGNNRVILATDGDFNVGMSSDGEMQRLIEEKRNTGIFLTCLGFGMGNYKDSKLETLADKGNGNYAYIDNLLEAKKVLVTEIGGTLLTLAKDVKIQVEFNPMIVESYRLVGYENRLLNEEDFNDDKKDAGEIGAGHSVTALYELVLKGSGTAPTVDPLRYQSTDHSESALSNEMLTVKFRYKKPTEDTSILIEKNLLNATSENDLMSDDFNFSAAVASFAMLIRNSEFKGTASFDSVLQMAQKAKGNDKNGYRAEFIRIVEIAKGLYM